jgi:hypothetical protein
MVQVRQGKLNFTTMSDIPEGASVLTSTFSINDTPVKILFGSGATHSFISEKLLGKMCLKSSHTNSSYKIITPGGQITSNILIRGVCLGLGSEIFPTNVIATSLAGMDVILGMDWMTQHKVVLDISDRVVEINSPTVGHTTFYLLSYGPPWAHYLSGYQDRLLGGPLGLPDLRCTVPDGVKHKDYRGEVLG